MIKNKKKMIIVIAILLAVVILTITLLGVFSQIELDRLIERQSSFILLQNLGEDFLFSSEDGAFEYVYGGENHYVYKKIDNDKVDVIDLFFVASDKDPMIRLECRYNFCFKLDRKENSIISQQRGNFDIRNIDFGIQIDENAQFWDISSSAANMDRYSKISNKSNQISVFEPDLTYSEAKSKYSEVVNSWWNTETDFEVWNEECELLFSKYSLDKVCGVKFEGNVKFIYAETSASTRATKEPEGAVNAKIVLRFKLYYKNNFYCFETFDYTRTYTNT